MTVALVSYIFVCAATAYVCTAVKEDDADALAVRTLWLLLWLAGGIAAFGLVIQIFTMLAG